MSHLFKYILITRNNMCPHGVAFCCVKKKLPAVKTFKWFTYLNSPKDLLFKVKQVNEAVNQFINHPLSSSLLRG